MRKSEALVAYLEDAGKGYSVEDEKGSRLVVGSSVKCVEFDIAVHQLVYINGIVTDISDPDGDVDDDTGRHIDIAPVITVRFEGGWEDKFSSRMVTGIYAYPYDDDRYCDPITYTVEDLIRS
jgi:hypothetical protein